jgi:hypothetical protein
MQSPRPYLVNWSLRSGKHKKKSSREVGVFDVLYNPNRPQKKEDHQTQIQTSFLFKYQARKFSTN